MKRILSLILVITVIIGTLGTMPMHRTAAATPSLAEMMPADLFSFTEVNLDEAPATLTLISDLLRQANIPNTIVADMDRSLTQALRRPASFAKDILPWLGSRAAIGVSIPDNIFESLFVRRPYNSKDPQAEYYALIMVKDEAAADAFLKDILDVAEKSNSKLTRADDKIGDAAAAVYSDKQNNQIIARWKGYLAVGGPSISRLLDTLKNKKPTLASDPFYKRIAGMMKPNNTVFSYTRTPGAGVGYVLVLALMGPAIGNIFENIVRDLQRTPGGRATATPTRTPTPTPAPEQLQLAALARNLGATGYGLYSDKKSLALDTASYIDPDALGKVFTLMKIPAEVNLQAAAKPISLKMADRVSSKASFVMLGSGLAQQYKNSFVLARVYAKIADYTALRPTSSAQVESSSAQLESSLKTLFGLDLNEDILSWLGGDYAFYVTLDTSAAAAPNAPPPANIVGLIQSMDAKKTEATLSKFNEGIGKLLRTEPTKTDDGLFTIDLTPTSVSAFAASRFGYGLVQDTLLFTDATNLSVAAGAARGDGILANDAQWKEAVSLLPKSYQHVWYANVDTLGALLQKLTATSRNQSDKQFAAFVSQFKSALLYSADSGGGSSLTTLVLLVKGQ